MNCYKEQLIPNFTLQNYYINSFVDIANNEEDIIKKYKKISLDKVPQKKLLQMYGSIINLAKIHLPHEVSQHKKLPNFYFMLEDIVDHSQAETFSHLFSINFKIKNEHMLKYCLESKQFQLYHHYLSISISNIDYSSYTLYGIASVIYLSLVYKQENFLDYLLKKQEAKDILSGHESYFLWLSLFQANNSVHCKYTEEHTKLFDCLASYDCNSDFFIGSIKDFETRFKNLNPDCSLNMNNFKTSEGQFLYKKINSYHLMQKLKKSTSIKIHNKTLHKI